MINRILMFFVNLMQKYLPDPFTIVWMITLFVGALAVFVTHKSPMEVIDYWGKGFFDILAFAMQMSLVLITGYALASAGSVRCLLQRIVLIPRTPKQTILFISAASMILYYLNWGLGLIAGGFLAREAAKQHKDTDFRILVTAAFSGIIITHGGLSASVPLVVNTKGHFLESQMGLVPLTQTIFHPQALFITITLAVLIPIICMFMLPKKEDVVLADSSLLAEEEEVQEKIINVQATLADRLDNSVILNYLLGLSGLAYLIAYFSRNGFNLNVNILIFMFIVMGILAHGNLLKFSKAIGKGAATASGIILQFPFYAGIMGIMHGSGLVHVISDLLLQMATYETFELACYFSSLIISIFVPSAGGHWVVQAPFMLPAAAELGVEPWKVAMGVAWGESIWNIVCPFWALPLLAIANMNIRDLMGFSVLLFFIGNIVAVAGILLIPH